MNVPEIVISDTNPKQAVYIYGCKGCTVQVMLRKPVMGHRPPYCAAQSSCSVPALMPASVRLLVNPCQSGILRCHVSVHRNGTSNTPMSTVSLCR